MMKGENMNRNWISSILIPLVGLLVVLAIAYGCERMNEALLALNARLFDLTLTMIIIPWSFILTTLLTTGIMMLLFWFVMIRTSRSRIIGLIFLIIGLFGVSFEILFLYAGQRFTLFWPFFIGKTLDPNSLVFHMAAGIAISGLFILLLPKSPQFEKSNR
jgi:hypothetical protein